MAEKTLDARDRARIAAARRAELARLLGLTPERRADLQDQTNAAGARLNATVYAARHRLPADIGDELARTVTAMHLAIAKERACSWMKLDQQIGGAA